MSSSPLRLVIDALQFAAQKHTLQRRKDQEASPYVNHLIAVAHILQHEGGVEDPVTIAAGILHDTVEDTDTTFEELTERFGQPISDLVREVTDDKSLPKETRKQLQIDTASKKSERAKLIKIADKISNLRDLASSPPNAWSAERIEEYFDWAKRVVDNLRGAHPTLEAAFDEAWRAGRDARGSASMSARDEIPTDPS